MEDVVETTKKAVLASPDDNRVLDSLFGTFSTTFHDGFGPNEAFFIPSDLNVPKKEAK